MIQLVIIILLIVLVVLMPKNNKEEVKAAHLLIDKYAMPVAKKEKSGTPVSITRKAIRRFDLSSKSEENVAFYTIIFCLGYCFRRACRFLCGK